MDNDIDIDTTYHCDEGLSVFEIWNNRLELAALTGGAIVTLGWAVWLLIGILRLVY